MDAQDYSEVIILAPTGRVDHTSAEVFQTELLEHVTKCAAADKHIILDLSGIDYMSSVGLRALMIASKESKKTDLTIVVSALQPDMKEIFEISRFHFVFKTFETTAEAIKGFSDAAVAAYAAAGEG
ncbi:MAG: STAS domain-containing protein [Alphaproteobacteria bacterium]|jgi:anti-anti-sigma factor|nr:STAS domain-containing protein [Alphaproteobacteria bacterium]MBT4017568.1 STAS domain-containing protein [Alphaproteobacteria bacterium]MBT4966107.1 STAS domain-containing protein [Alphaproteobacteria bacterium]MBT5159433.1 STAS domain-containing protein [Alphaproteobacteria bacterium]MBT5917926.1 STAS domain-containing protein [Alphaproteobacteria bacterium]